MDKRVYWVWLTNLSGMFSHKINALLDYFDDIEEIYKATDYTNVEGITRTDSFVLNNKDLTKAKKLIEETEKIGGKILTFDDINFPDSVRRIENPAYVLYVKGEIMQWDRILPVAVIGTRECSDYGIAVTKSISYHLAKRGITIVAGMARGIDGMAARAALEAGNKTIAVLGSGLDVVYPPEHKDLMENIINHGTVITEYPLGSQALKHHFPERNRIISALSKGVLVVEAPKISGALITANYAQTQGKDIFAVPGSIFEDNCKGTNRLIAEGAKIATCAMDIMKEYPKDMARLVPIEDYDKKVNNIRHISPDDEKYANLNANEKKVILALIESNMHIEDLKRETCIDITSLNSMLPMLEMMGFIRKLPGDNYKLEV